MKRIILPLCLSLFIALALPISAVTAIAQGESETSKEDYYIISKEEYENIYETIRQEVQADFQEQLDAALNTGYKEVSANQGQVILIPNGSEIIYRGGGAIAITSSDSAGDGLKDISLNKELFSGQKLEYGHIYTSLAGSAKAVLVTGTTASFTIRGNYEIS